MYFFKGQLRLPRLSCYLSWERSDGIEIEFGLRVPDLRGPDTESSCDGNLKFLQLLLIVLKHFAGFTWEVPVRFWKP